MDTQVWGLDQSLLEFIKSLIMFFFPYNGFNVWSLSSFVQRFYNQSKVRNPNPAEPSHSWERAELPLVAGGVSSAIAFIISGDSCLDPGVKIYPKQFTLCLEIWAFFLETQYPRPPRKFRVRIVLRSEASFEGLHIKILSIHCKTAPSHSYKSLRSFSNTLVMGAVSKPLWQHHPGILLMGHCFGVCPLKCKQILRIWDRDTKAGIF